jgi:hypothetical protein
VAGTCFALVGLWLGVVQFNKDWLQDAQQRALAGVYLSFLIPGVMSLIAQAGGENKLIWRATFVTRRRQASISQRHRADAHHGIDRPVPAAPLDRDRVVHTGVDLWRCAGTGESTELAAAASGSDFAGAVDHHCAWVDVGIHDPAQV